MTEMLQDFEKRFWRRIVADAEAACEHMNPAELTNDQEAALCIIAGVPWSVEKQDDHSYRPVTAPASVTLVDGKWKVSSRSLVWDVEIRER